MNRTGRAIGLGVAVAMSYGAVSCSNPIESPETVLLTPETNLPPPIPLDGVMRTIVCVETENFEDCESEENLLATTVAQDRQVVSLDEIPYAAQLGAIASEDRLFFSHPGIAVKGIVRAGVANFKDNLNLDTLVDQDITFSEGASTITQQVIDDRYGLDLNDSIAEKIQEAEFAMGLEINLKPYCAYLLDIPAAELYPGGQWPAYEQGQIDGCGKDFILTDYFNRKNFGRDSDGYHDAAMRTFGIPGTETNPPQALILDANLQSPSRTDMTSTDPDTLDDEISRNQDRYEVLVNDLLGGGEIDKAEAELLIRAYNNETEEYGPSAISTVIPYVPVPGGIDTLPARAICAEHLSVRAIDEAAKRLGVTADDISKRGYSIVTFTDRDLQEASCDEVTAINDNTEGYEAAMTAIRKDGTMMAMIGGTNRDISQVNLATGAEGGGSGDKDWGSVRKVQIVAAALENGMDPNAVFTVNGEVPIPGAFDDAGNPYVIDTRDACRQIYGAGAEAPCEESVTQILGASSNVGAAEIMLTMGSEPGFGAINVYELDRETGGDILGDAVPSVVIGSGGGSTKGFANAYNNLLLNEGQVRYIEGEDDPEDPAIVDRIYNSDGALVWSYDRDLRPFIVMKQAISKQAANDTVQLQRSATEESYGTASGALNVKANQGSLKTGSATDGTGVTLAGVVSDSEIGVETGTVESGGVAYSWWVGYPDNSTQELPEEFSSGDLARAAGRSLDAADISNDDSQLPGNPARINR